jgi:WD40 repeat protein
LGVFQNENINSIISFTEKHIHVWAADDGDQMKVKAFFDDTGSHSISCVTYSKKNHLYMIVSTDFKLHVFNEFLNYVGQFSLQSRLVNNVIFLDQTSQLLTAGIDGCFIHHFVVRNKYEPKQSLMLDPEGDQINIELGPKRTFDQVPLWTKGFKVIIEENWLVSWSQLKLTIHDLDGKLLHKYQNLTAYEDFITDFLVSRKYKYFITSTNQGNIFVWKIGNQKEMIHHFQNQASKVTSMQPMPGQPNIFISASNDHTIRL